MVQKKIIEKNMKNDQELEMLLNEIPHATSSSSSSSLNDYDYDHDMMKFSSKPSSPITVSDFSLKSDGSSSSSLFSVMEDLKSNITGKSSNTFLLDSNTDKRFVDQLDLCANFNQMYIANANVNVINQEQKNVPNVNDFGLLSENYLINVNNDYNNKFVDFDSYKGGFLDSDYVGFQSSFLRNPNNNNNQYGDEMNSVLRRDCDSFGLSKPCFENRVRDNVYSRFNGFCGSMDSLYQRRQLMNQYYCRESVAPELVVPPLSRNSAVDASVYAQKYGMNFLQEHGMSRLPNHSVRTNFRPCMTAQDMQHYGRVVPPPSNARIPQGNIDAITSEGSIILKDEGLTYVAARGSDRSMCQNVGCEYGFAKQLHRSELDIQQPIVGTCENPRSSRIGSPLTLPPMYNSLWEARGYIYLMAKDQNGCRFLQRMFDQGRMEDVQVIFSEIIGHVVELMMNPFGNYLMQKLLDVCSEEQRMHIIFMVIEDPGQLVRISLNAHGTRVVQKLIETLKTRQQISLVVSALEPGFLALIKDLNGNHVVQHCLECLSNEDNRFIFVAATKYCFDIATHQHGCCVLQKCIGYSSGEHKEKLVAEISANAFRLAEHKYGNYVVQYILDLRIPSAATTLHLQFEGNYAHMSRQRFSSHVVEKCIAVFNDENRAKIIHELLSDPHFDILLQDPHANYVIQKALRHSEGRVYNSLVKKIESFKAICRNSPYSKKIFSQKLLKK